MPVLLFGIGAFALLAGLVMVGFGIPINEFSFGNTLISAGTTAIVGGLIIIGLGVVVGQLRRVAEALAVQSSARFGQPVEDYDLHRVLLRRNSKTYPIRRIKIMKPFLVESGGRKRLAL